MVKSKNVKVNILFLCMLLTHIVLPLVLQKPLRELSFYSLLLVSQIFIQLPVCIYLVVTDREPESRISFRPFSLKAAILVILMTYSILPLVSLVNAISMLFVENVVAGMTGMMDSSNLWLNLFYIALVPALSEEFAFRGVIFHETKPRGKWLAVFLSAFFFGMMHLNFNQFCYTFTIGIAMALTTLATGSFWGSVIMHFILNANSVLMLKAADFILGKMTTELDPQVMGEMLQAGPQTQNEILAMIPPLLLLAVIMLVPAICFFVSISKICKTTDIIYGMFGRGGKREPEQQEQLGSDETVKETGEKEAGKKKQNNVVDLFLILDIAIAFGYMIYMAV